MAAKDDDIYVLGYAEHGKFYVRSDFFLTDVELRAMCEAFVPVTMIEAYIKISDFETFFDEFVEFDVSYDVLKEMYIRTLVGYYKDSKPIEEYVRKTIAGEFGDLAPELQYDTYFLRIRRHIRERQKMSDSVFFEKMRHDMTKAVRDYLMDDMYAPWRSKAPVLFQKFYLDALNHS